MGDKSKSVKPNNSSNLVLWKRQYL